MSTGCLSKIIMTASAAILIHAFISSELADRFYNLWLIVPVGASQARLSWISDVFIDRLGEASLSGGKVLWMLRAWAESIERGNSSPLLRGFWDLFLKEVSPTLGLGCGDNLDILASDKRILNLSAGCWSHRSWIPINNAVNLDFPIYANNVSGLHNDLLLFRRVSFSS